MIIFKRKNLWKLPVLLLILGNLILASWYLIHGDLYFHTDIARDFLLLSEIQEKKFMLIGPRAGAAGFFHGPLWSYLNFPVFFLSNGNPLAVGWFWIFLIIASLIINFFIVRSLFNEKTAYFFLIFLSGFLISLVREFTHPYAGILIAPAFYYTFYKYITTLKVKYLAFNVLIIGLLIQLEIAFGAPILLLSFLYIFYLQVKKRKLNHAFVFLLLLIPLSTYIIFDLRHDFFQLKSLITYVKGGPNEDYVGFFNIFKNRINYMITAGVPLSRNFILDNRIFAIGFFMALLFRLIKEKKDRQLYLIFLYFFFGYFILSLFNRYYLLQHHFVAYIPIVFMIISSFVMLKYKKVFLPFIILIIFFNELSAIQFIKNAKNFIGRSEDSWQFLAHLSQEVFVDSDSEFGYFIYAPDKLAYEPKYAMMYARRKYPDRQAYYFQKKPVTYVISAPPPPEKPHMKSDWWVKNSIKITKEPQKVLTYPNGYKVERYELTAEEMIIPFDQHEDVGIHFR